MNFFKYFLLKKSQKGGYLPAGDDVASGARWRADVVRRTTARVRRGAKATWQSRGWPTRGAGGAQGADTWQEATRVHAGPRGRLCGAPRGNGGRHLEGPRVSGPW